MAPSVKIWIGAATLLAGVVLAHCVWILAVGVRIVRLLLETSPARVRFWSALVGAAAVGAVAWLTVALVGVGALALWLRVQQVRP